MIRAFWRNHRYKKTLRKLLPDMIRAFLRNHSYKKTLRKLQDRYMDYPCDVSIETYTVCNASCDFCPFTSIKRKGTMMPTSLFSKIIDDLTDIPQSLPLTITLARVNEPFLDKRIFQFAREIDEKLPGRKIQFFSNASPLNKNKIEQLLSLNNVRHLSLSLNDHRPENYEETMKLSFKRTFANLTLLHDMKKLGEIPFHIGVTRVGDNTRADNEFIKWGRKVFPEFTFASNPRCDWLGMKPTGTRFSIPNMGCAQWFKLHFLADGNDAFCCIDAEGKYGKGRVQDSSALNIYNNPEYRRRRGDILSRSSIRLCAQCPMKA